MSVEEAVRGDILPVVFQLEKDGVPLNLTGAASFTLSWRVDEVQQTDLDLELEDALQGKVRLKTADRDDFLALAGVISAEVKVDKTNGERATNVELIKLHVRPRLSE